MKFRPIKTKKIYEEIIEQIKLMIEDGNLKPGDKLLSERELAENLKVSRASVREALVALEMIGLLEIKPGEGTFVKKVDFETMIKPLTFALLEHKTILEALELRKILEVDAAGMAAKMATSDQIKKMEKALVQMEKDIYDEKLGDMADFSFHSSIYVATQNSLLIKLVNTISDTLINSLTASRQILYVKEDAAELLLAEHRRIFEAITQGDERLARIEMFKHLERVEKLIVESLNAQKK